MTSDEKFEQWWAEHEIECIPAHALTRIEYELFKNAARTAWSARLSDEDEATCIAALDLAAEHYEEDARMRDERNGPSNFVSKMWRERNATFDAVRRRLEGK